MLTAWSGTRYCIAYVDDMMFSEPFRGYVVRVVDYKKATDDVTYYDEPHEAVDAMAALSNRWWVTGDAFFTRRQVEFYAACKARFGFEDSGSLHDWTAAVQKEEETQLSLF